MKYLPLNWIILLKVSFFFCTILVNAQNDLLDEIDTNVGDEKELATWKSLKVVNFETTKIIAKNEFQFIVSHRFGSISDGFDTFFGLDNAATRLQFGYGLTDWMHIEASRSSYDATYQVAGKFKLLSQTTTKTPVSIALYTAFDYNSQLDEVIYPLLETKHRLGYTFQAIFARKFTRDFSFELAPTFFHDNFVLINEQDNSQFAIGIGGRYKIATRWSINADYGIHFNRADNSPFVNPLSIGVDLETGGHVFQMHFTNSQPMLTNAFMGEATGDWLDGRIFFGFNLVRVF